MSESCTHEQAWLLLPWLANGRLPAAQRTAVEEHVRGCAPCLQELAHQRLVCAALTAPERITYAPGPSFRKLIDAIDGRAPRVQPPAAPAVSAAGRAGWRPGVAWAASVLLLVAGSAVLAVGAYRWSQPRYTTRTTVSAATPDVLHIAFVPSLSIGEAGMLLHSAGARVVDGPDATGIFAVAPVTAAAAPATPAAPAPGPRSASPAMRALAARLRADARVRWVEPLVALDTPAVGTGPQAPQP